MLIINRKGKRRFIPLLFFLVMLLCTPVWANGEQESTSSEILVVQDSAAIGIGGQVIGGTDNVVTGVGAIAGPGQGNIAGGIGGQVIAGSNNDVQGIGGIVGAGSENAAAGVGAQVVGSSNVQASGIGAIAGEGNYNTAVGVGVQVVGNTQEVAVSKEQNSEGDNQAVGYGAQAGEGTANRSIGYGAQAGIGNGNTAIGTAAQAGYGNANTAIGIGAQAGASDLNTAVGAGAVATAGNSVAIGANSVATRPSTVSVGAPGAERQITNVAPGTVGTDAVNLNQLNNVESRVDRIGATAIAFSALAPLPYDPEEPTQFSVGFGTYNGQNAFSLGMFHYIKNDVMVNLAFGMSSDGWEKAGRVGITWRIGGSRKHKEVTEPVVIKSVADESVTPVENSTTTINATPEIAPVTPGAGIQGNG